MMLERYGIRNWKRIMSKMIQLFILPFAGGNASAFDKLIPCIDKRIETMVLEYAGHGNRKRESFYQDYQSMLADVEKQISGNQVHLPYSILGYSMGGNLAFDLISRNTMEKKPVHVFICARDAVYQKGLSYSYHLLSDEDFSKKMISLGGIDKRIAANPKFLSIYMKPIREDYRLLSQFQYKEGSMIPCDTTVIYSKQDMPYERVKGWSRLSKGMVDFYEIGDNHFFIFEDYKKIADIINKKLCSATT